MLQEELLSMINQNKNAEVSKIEAFPLNIVDDDNNYDYFFCGAVVDNRGHIIGIPNKYPRILDINPQNNKIEQWGELKLPEGKGWTGGALASNGLVYGFPRGANAFLEIDTENRSIEYLPLNRDYRNEHHYGGTITKNQCIYLPPKKGKSILKFDIRKSACNEIPIPSILKRKFLFYGGMTDLEENVYFFPAGSVTRVCMLAKNERPKFVGRPMRHTVFNSGTLAPNGDVYSFSSYSKGILHINTKNKQTEILQKDFDGGCFGAKLAFNGKIYGIPGDSNVVAEFNPELNKITKIIPLPDVEIGAKAKCAGGAIDREGNIWCVPAMGHYIYKISFDGIQSLPSKELYESKYFKSVY